jgi:hypothetical protein
VQTRTIYVELNLQNANERRFARPLHEHVPVTSRLEQAVELLFLSEVEREDRVHPVERTA